MTLRHPVTRLQDLLEAWEEHKYVLSTAYTAARMVAVPLAVQQYREFRSYLRHASVDKPFDNRRFCVEPSRLDNTTDMQIQALNTDARYLHSWSVHSRRVFHLDAAMAQQLMMTKLDGLRWIDIHMPFDTFAVTLEQPMKFAHRAPDCFLITSDQDGIGILALSAGNRSWKRLPDKMRKVLDKPGQHRRLRNIKKATRFINAGEPSSGYIRYQLSSRMIEDEFRDDFSAVINGDTISDEQIEGEHLLIVRLLLGLCLYLEQRPGNYYRASKPEVKRISSVDPTAVTHDIDVMTVADVHSMKSEVIQSIRQSGKAGIREVCAHWRRGYWKRARGTGHIPDAPRNVWVRPTLVREDRVPIGGLPGGIKTVLKQ